MKEKIITIFGNMQFNKKETSNKIKNKYPQAFNILIVVIVIIVVLVNTL